MSAHTDPKRSRLWSMPVLRSFAPPIETPVDEGGASTGAEIVPWSLPGSKLRSSAVSARRGFYAPRLDGAPTTTKQAEILNTALIGPPTGTRGVVNGRDVLSRTSISHDPITAYNTKPKRLVSSPNVIAMGDVGSGKSSHVKTNYVLRPLLLNGRRAVVFDKKDRAGEGEYSEATRSFGVEPIKFAVDGSGSTLNLLDPLISRGTGVDGQFRLLSIITRLARNDQPVTNWEEEALRAALRATVDNHDRRAAVLADVLPNLGNIADDPEYRQLSEGARDELHMAGLSVKFTLNGLLDEYGGLLDGETSKSVNLGAKLTSFDISQLPDDGPAVPVVMAIGHMWLLGRLRTERTAATNVIWEEGWHVVVGPTGQLLRSSEKLARGLGISNVFVMHKGTDIPKDSPGIAAVQEAQTIVVYRQSRQEDAVWCQQTFGFAPETAQTIENLRDGHYIFKYGANPETHVQHIRSAWETQLTNTDEGLAAGSVEQY